jgi:hypothetical protein
MTEDEGYQKAALRYSVTYMSNAKWVRLFTTAVRTGIVIERAQWTLGSDYSVWEGFPQESNLLPTRFQDGRFQPFEYNWIRSIHVPREYRPIADVGHTRKQNVDGLKAAIDAVGAFQMELTEEGLTILGYAP